MKQDEKKNSLGKERKGRSLLLCTRSKAFKFETEIGGDVRGNVRQLKFFKVESCLVSQLKIETNNNQKLTTNSQLPLK